MKVYVISTPDVLCQVAESIKWDKDYRKAMALANKWFKDRGAYKVTLELGKNANLMVEHDGDKSLLATMYTAAAKDFVKELKEA